jgi:hypothetical protein
MTTIEVTAKLSKIRTVVTVPFDFEGIDAGTTNLEIEDAHCDQLTDELDAAGIEWRLV